MNEHGFELERGELNSEAKHKTVAEFKQRLPTRKSNKNLFWILERQSMPTI